MESQSDFYSPYSLPELWYSYIATFLPLTSVLERSAATLRSVSIFNSLYYQKEKHFLSLKKKAVIKF